MNTMYEIPVEIAAPLHPYRGTRKLFPTKFTAHAVKGATICSLLFFKNTNPTTVVSESVYIIGEKAKKGSNADASRYFSPNNKTIMSLNKIRNAPKQNIIIVIVSLTFI